MAIQAPWAVLLCRFSDDTNDPATTRISTLYRQWGNSYGAAWLADNVTRGAEVDNRTILELYEIFFSITGLFTWNVVRYFDEMSHGRVDVSATRVFPCTLDLTIAQGRALDNTPGGFAYETEMFRRAKAALMRQHGVDWHSFSGGVAVSFQSDVPGRQGYTNIDGGPGVFADIRFVRSQGTSNWGHEMGHAFGLDHSRTDGQFTSACTGGDPSDYTDWWDIMSGPGCAGHFDDLNYGLTGPGLNAWNMRYRGWLDESRVWRGPANSDFSQRVSLRPLHHRNLMGYLGAELPTTSGNSVYLVEFRVPEAWDAAFPEAAIIVHRFDAGHSYVMKGAAGQKILRAGDVFETGTGPFSKVRVESIDAPARLATVLLCHSKHAFKAPSVKLRAGANPPPQFTWHRPSRCQLTNVANTATWFGLTLTAACLPEYTTHWMVTGATISSNVNQTTEEIQLILPPAGTAVSITVTVMFDNGVSVFDTLVFKTISQDQADWISFLCRLLDEDRKLPNPWWEWDPAALRPILDAHDHGERKLLLERAERIVSALRHTIDTRH
jgi:hypothetical protein